MSRRIFISYQSADRAKAKGFNLLQWNKNVDIEFVGRHLLDPVNSENKAYIRDKIREQLHGTSVTVVLIGKETCDSEWVQWEIQESLEKNRPNGVLAIRLDETATLPAGCAVGNALYEAGAEIIDWNPHSFADAIERAAEAAGRARSIALGKGTGVGESSCSR